MLTDTTLLPGFDDPAPWDDSGGDQEEKRPGGKDQGDEMESDNDTESNANIIAADDGNINSNSGKNSSAVEEIRATKATTEEPKGMWAEILEEKENEQATQSKPAVNQSDDRTDWVKKMSALSEQLRNKDNDGWKQHESVPPVGIHEDIKKSESGIAVREGKEFRQRDKLVIESREITQPEATERHETHEAEQSQGQQETVSENVVKATKPVTRQRKSQLDLYYESTWCNGLAVEGACRALRAKRISSATTRSVLMILAENAHQDEDGLCVEMAQTVIAAVLKVKQSTVSKAIGDLKEAGLIGRVDDSYTVGTNTNTGKAIRYRMLFSVRG